MHPHSSAAWVFSSSGHTIYTCSASLTGGAPKYRGAARGSPTIPDRYDKSLRLGQGRVVSKAATAEKESVDGITVFFQNVGPGIAYDVDFEVIKDSEAGDFLVDNQKPSSWHSQKNPMRTLARGQKYPSRL